MGDRLGIPRAVDFFFFFFFFFFLFLGFALLSLFLWSVSFLFLLLFICPFLCSQFFSCLFVWFLVVVQSPFTENGEISFERHFLQFSVMESEFLRFFSAFALG